MKNIKININIRISFLLLSSWDEYWFVRQTLLCLLMDSETSFCFSILRIIFDVFDQIRNYFVFFDVLNLKEPVPHVFLIQYFILCFDLLKSSQKKNILLKCFPSDDIPLPLKKLFIICLSAHPWAMNIPTKWQTH